MTQTPPSPAQGIAVAPTTVTAGVTSSIPFPATASGGPTPWRVPWVVLLNSSPYTLIVDTGSTTTQIAAFTSDKVFVFAAGPSLPVTVTPQPGSGLVSPASDFTVYATWYHDEPPGTYPAALGSGAVATAGSTGLVNSGAIPIVLGPGATFSLGTHPTLGYGGVVMYVQELSGNGPLTVNLFWSDVLAASLATRQVIVPASGNAEFALPHVGAIFTATIVNNTAGNVSYSVRASMTLSPIAQWAARGTAGDDSVLIAASASAIPNATPTVYDVTTFVYAGPVSWYTFWNNTTAGVASVEYQRGDASWHTLSDVRIGAAPALSPIVQPPPLTLIVPPNPLRILVNQTSGGPTTPIFTLAADDWRVAC